MTPMVTSYHVHTRWSDGEGEIGDYIRAAPSHGLTELGFSDHLVLDPGGAAHTWSMPCDGLESYVGAIAEERETGAAAHIAIRTGLELDYFPGSEAIMRDILSRFPFDYVIGSVHFVDSFPVDAEASYWDALGKKERNDIVRLYWERVRQLAESGLCDIIAHLDLYKKFGHYPSEDLTQEINTALDAIACNDLACELNTSGAFKPARDMYPSTAILKKCVNRKIPVIITADAHNPAHLTRHFTEARALLSDLGGAATPFYVRRTRNTAR